MMTEPDYAEGVNVCRAPLTALRRPELRVVAGTAGDSRGSGGASEAQPQSRRR
ncbi:MAG: hypothetical protein R2716_10390 [Microthrixaceae bacterium]